MTEETPNLFKTRFAFKKSRDLSPAVTATYSEGFKQHFSPLYVFCAGDLDGLRQWGQGPPSGVQALSSGGAALGHAR